MASETNELTFVRCPTCRSLVPASASKCRICNAALDASSKSGTAPSQPPVSRVRQKTVTATPEAVKAMASSKAPPSAPPQASPVAENSVPVEPAPTSTSTNSEDDAFDPLGAFLQDLDSEEKDLFAEADTPVTQSVEVEQKSELFDDGESDEDDLDDSELDDEDFDIFDDPSFEDLLEDPTESSDVSSAGMVPEQAVVDGAESVDDDQYGEEEPAMQDAPVAAEQPVSRVLENPSEGSARPTRSAPGASRSPEERLAGAPPQRRGEQGPIKPKIAGMPRRSGSSMQGETRSTSNPSQAAPQVSHSRDVGTPPAQGRPAQGHTVQSPGQSISRQGPAIAVDSEPQMQAAIPASAKNNRPTQSPSPHVEPQSVQSPASVEPKDVARAHRVKTGRLFGWLVSYENPDGRAIELRAGRFFITGTSIRGSDLILEDQSISTPHALVAITDAGLQVQDLMSERGTFVRPQGEVQYTREEGVVHVQHGDWIRFGDVEFLVTIIPS